eukprot:jgi/Ulvmu1/4264/UM194_0004.1
MFFFTNCQWPQQLTLPVARAASSGHEFAMQACMYCMHCLCTHYNIRVTTTPNPRQHTNDATLQAGSGRRLIQRQICPRSHGHRQPRDCHQAALTATVPPGPPASTSSPVCCTVATSATTRAPPSAAAVTSTSAARTLANAAPALPPQPQDLPGDPSSSPRVVQPAEVTVVTSAAQLQAASEAAARDIEIRAHLDLRNLKRPPNPGISGFDGPNNDDSIIRLALFYVHSEMRSLRGNCSDPDAVAALGLPAEVAADMLPLKPRQCLVIVPDAFMMTIGGLFWLDNVYLRLVRTKALPGAAFVAAGAGGVLDAEVQVHAAQLYVTNVTFHAELRGSARGVALEKGGSGALLQDCIFTDWVGNHSPLRIFHSSDINVVDTVFRNMHLSVEIADVSAEGLVRFASTGFANVTLQRGRVVSTTANDFTLPEGYEHEYYDTDDADFDIELTPVPIANRTGFEAEFWVDDDLISDCIFLRAAPGTVMPGCPQVSLAARAAVLRRVSRGAASSPAQEVAPPLNPNEDELLADLLLRGESGWLQAMRSVLGPLPPAASWPEFVVPEREPVSRVGIGAKRQVVPAGVLVGGLRRTPEAVDASAAAAAAAAAAAQGPIVLAPPTGPQPLLGDAQLVAVVAVLTAAAAIAAAAVACALLTLRRHQAQRRRGTDKQVSDAPSGQTPQESTGQAPACGFGGGPPASAMNPEFEYVLPGHLALLAPPRRLTDSSGSSQTTRTLTPQCQRSDSRTSSSHTPRLGVLPWSADPSGSEDGGPSVPPVAAAEQLRRTHAGSADSGATRRAAADAVSAPVGPLAAVLGAARSLAVRSEKSGDTAVMSPYPSLLLGAGRGSSAAGSGSAQHSRSLTGPCMPTSGYSCVRAEMDLVRGIATTAADDASRAAHAAHARTGTDHGLVPPGPPQGQIWTKAVGSDKDRAGGASGGVSVSGGQQGGVVRGDERGRGSSSAHRAGGGTAGWTAKRLQRQLDAFGEADLFLGRYELLGWRQRRRGGQGVVQFAEDAADGSDYAIKFFLDRAAFLTEAALYSTCSPSMHSTMNVCSTAAGDPKTVDVAVPDAGVRRGVFEGGGSGSVRPMADVVVKFLPQVEAVCDEGADGLVDARGRPLPPCIVMEKGESLQDWSNRAEPDLFTALAVLSNISKRLADMHAAGYVHRDLKPANVMWLPRQNRWTIIDFGCVACIGAQSPVSYTLAYAPPEVLAACEARQPCMRASPALDSWSLGVMAYELLTGAPAYDLVQGGRSQVLLMLRGDLPLPWEGEGHGSAAQRSLGALRRPVLHLLCRDASRRSSPREFHMECTRAFGRQVTADPHV